MGEHREQIHRRLRLMGTQVIRVFVFDKPVPDPVQGVALVRRRPAGRARRRRQADGDLRQVPSALRRPAQHPRVRRPLPRDRLGLHRAVGRRGGEGLVLVHLERAEQSRRRRRRHATRSTAASTRRWPRPSCELLEPHLGGRKARSAGPRSTARSAPYWMDWIARLVAEVDDRMLGFVNWHMYADWRPAVPSETVEARRCGARPMRRTATVFEALVMAQTPQYEARARGVARLLHGRDILNVCGELNTVAHHEHVLHPRPQPECRSARAYYASALIHLIRGGADLEMRWTATSEAGLGRPRRRLRPDVHERRADAGVPGQAALRPARAVWRLDPLSRAGAATPDVDAIVAWNDEGRRSGVFVNTTARAASLTVVRLGRRTCRIARRCCGWTQGTGGRVARGAVRRDRPPATDMALPS